MAVLVAFKILRRVRAGRQGGYFHQRTVSEVAQAVQREHLAVDRFFMMHVKVAPQGEIVSLLASKR